MSQEIHYLLILGIVILAGCVSVQDQREEVVNVNSVDTSDINMGDVPTRCVENWQCSNWEPSECSESQEQNRNCIDLNNCQIETDRPQEIRSCELEIRCIENWGCADWSMCSDSSQLRTCIDSNTCGTEENKPANIRACEVSVSSGSPPQKIVLIVNDFLLPTLQPELDIWKQDVENEYNYTVVQKKISAEKPSEIKAFIKSQHDSGSLVGVLLVGAIPPVYIKDTTFLNTPYISDKYYLDTENFCFSTLINNEECKLIENLTIPCYKPRDNLKCTEFYNSNAKYWVARLTTPDYHVRSPLENEGNNIELLSAYFNRNHAYRTGQKSYDKKMLVFTPIWNDDPSKFEETKTQFLNQGSLIEKLNYYSGDTILATNPTDILNGTVFKSELENPYQYVYYSGHGLTTSAQGITSDEVIAIKPKALFYSLTSCSNGDFSVKNNLAASYLFQGDGLAVTAMNNPGLGTGDFPAVESFLLDNGYNFENITNNSLINHFYGDPTLRLTARTNSNIDIDPVDLGKLPIPVDSNSFYIKNFNVVMKNVGNQKINLAQFQKENNSDEINSFFKINSTLNKPFSLSPGEEKTFPSELLVHSSLQPSQFTIDYYFYSNSKEATKKLSISGELT